MRRHNGSPGARRAVTVSLALCLCAGTALAQQALPLSTALEMARSHSATLRIKSLEVDRARAVYREAVSRALPQVGLNATGTYMTNPQEGVILEQGSFGTLTLPTLPGFPPTVIDLPEEDVAVVEGAEPTYFQVSLGLDQVLWAWGKIERSIRVAALERQAAEIATREGARALARDTAMAYFGAVAARESLGLLDQAVELAAVTVADQEHAYAEGTLVQLDVLEARSQEAGIRAQRDRAREALQSALATLEYLTGSRPEPEGLITSPRGVTPALDETALLSGAIAGSAEIQTLSIRAQQARYAQDIRRASLMGLPDFSLRITVDITGQPVPFTENWMDGWDTNVLVTLAGRVTLFDSLSSVWRLEQAAAQREQAVQAESELRRSLGVQVRRRVESARVASATVIQREAEGALAAERARSATVGLENDMVTRAEERRARVASVAAELALVGARLEVEYALLGLEYMTAQALPR